MTTEKLIEIAGAALCDSLCEGCDIEENDEIFGSCFECRAYALTEIKNRLKGSILLGKEYPVSEFKVSVSKGLNDEHMFSIEKAEWTLTPKRGIQGR